MADESLEFLCEKTLIELIGVSSDVQVSHGEQAANAALDQIGVIAERQPQMASGGKPFPVKVRVIYYSGQRDPEAMDKAAQEVIEILMNPVVNETVTTLQPAPGNTYSWFEIDEENFEVTKDDKKKIRKRIITVTLIVKLS